MPPLGELDLPDRFAAAIPRPVTQAGFGLACGGTAVALRIALDLVVAGGTPFALTFPAMMLATLFARWLSGLCAAAAGIGYAWFHGFAPGAGPQLGEAAEIVTVGCIIGAALVTIAIAEGFRRAARRATQQRDREIAERDLLLQEIDHRMKNNFAIVASILDIQRRRTAGEAAEALGAALARVESIARAHRHLYRGAGQADAVDMKAYIGDLCGALADALLLRGGVSLSCSADAIQVPRDRAVSIGLVINELVTNAAKHAFTGRAGGTITVGLRCRPGGMTLIVSDDGAGMPASTAPRRPDQGLGARLIPAFARQAGGTLATESGPDGTTVTMDMPG